MAFLNRKQAVALSSLVLQNSALVLILRHSRTAGGPQYYSTTAVVLSEIIKSAIAAAALLRTDAASIGQLGIMLFGPHSDWKRMMVPAFLYSIQNNLQYLAASLLDPATFQVTYQLKIITTAGLSVLLLGKRLSPIRWLSLIVLTAGVALVQLPNGAADRRHAGAARQEGDIHNALESENTRTGIFGNFLGLIIVGIACCLSGLAGVYFEMVLKKTVDAGSGTPRKPPGIWERTAQLSLTSVIVGAIVGALFEGPGIMENSFFHGYNFAVWCAIGLQALGGIIVAMVVKYADNILKGFATSISIIISCVASIYLFDFFISLHFILGAGLVIAATLMYSTSESRGRSLKKH